VPANWEGIQWPNLKLLHLCFRPQVVLAFHAGRLGASLSFMGKGVTYYSSLCLAHLTHEMAVIDPTQVFHCLRNCTKINCDVVVTTVK